MHNETAINTSESTAKMAKGVAAASLKRKRLLAHQTDRINEVKEVQMIRTYLDSGRCLKLVKGFANEPVQKISVSATGILPWRCKKNKTYKKATVSTQCEINK